MVLLQVRTTSRPQQLIEFLLARRAYFITTGMYFFERIYLLVIGIVLYAVLARTYGPALLGVYSFAQTLVTFATPFLAAGAEAIVIRELVRNKNDTSRVMGAAFALITLSTIVVMAAPVGFALLSHSDSPLAIQIAFFLSLSLLPNGLMVIEHFFKSEMRAASIVLPRTGLLTLSLGVKLYLAIAGYPIIGVAVTFAVEAALLAVLMLSVYISHGHSPLSWRFDRQEMVFLFKQALPAMISAAAVLVFFRINHILLAHFSDYAELGKYSAAFQMFQLTGILPLVLFSSLYPRLVTLHQTNQRDFRRLLNWLYFGFALTSYLIYAFTYLFSDTIIHLLLGERFAGANGILSVLIFSSTFTFLGSVRAQEINIYNVPVYHLVNASIGLVAQLPISLYLIPRYGAAGAAWGVTAGCFVSGVLTSFIFSRTRAAGWAQLRAMFLIPPLALGRSSSQPSQN